MTGLLACSKRSLDTGFLLWYFTMFCFFILILIYIRSRQIISRDSRKEEGTVWYNFHRCRQKGLYHLLQGNRWVKNVPQSNLLHSVNQLLLAKDFILRFTGNNLVCGDWFCGHDVDCRERESKLCNNETLGDSRDIFSHAYLWSDFLARWFTVCNTQNVVKYTVNVNSVFMI